MHLRDQILAEIENRLGAIDVAPEQWGVRVDPGEPAQAEDIPGLTVRSGNETLSNHVEELECLDAPRQWSVGIEIRTQVNTGNPLLARPNDMLTEVQKALWIDYNLGGLVNQMWLGPITYESSEDAEFQLVLVTMVCQLLYYYRLSDPETAIT